ncbi:MAG: LacI family DNA-binding transcriptional regulator [Silicimonas sp.]|nr:LacI family DNA-binding transcriptional regulator [Silicimonas sp.]
MNLPKATLTPAERERPTLKTLARLSGLSVPTVSRALSDAPDIKPATKIRIRALADELGYRPNRAGLRLRTGKTHVVSLVLGTDHDLMNHTARLINAVASALRPTAYHLTVTPYFPDEDPVDPIRRIVASESADGVILNRIQPRDPRIDYLLARNIPFATHGRREACSTDPYFDFDNTAFGRIGCESLARRGRQNILIVAPPPTQSYSLHMLEGVRQAARATGIVAEVLQDADSDCPSHQITAAITRHLHQYPQTDGVLCASTSAAIDATVAVESGGLVLGDTVDIAAKEAIPFLRAFRRAILVFPEDLMAAGHFLARALINAIDASGEPAMQALDTPSQLEDI